MRRSARSRSSLRRRDFDAALLADLPPSTDPCGERGEFHSFAYDGPMFSRPVPIESGVVVERDGFVFADLTLASSGPATRLPRADQA